MSLLKCKECAGQVSTHAKTCPHCGTPYYNGKKIIFIKPIIYISIVATIFICFKFFVFDRIKSNFSEITSSSNSANKVNFMDGVKGKINKLVQEKMGVSSSANIDMCSNLKSMMNQLNKS
jgi:hypothetical protein